MMQPMVPYPLTLQLGMKQFHGHVFLAPSRLYFVCSKQGGAWAQAIGQSVGGLIGGAIAAIGHVGPGQGQAAIGEAELQQAVEQNQGSIVMEATQITEIKETLWWRLIRWDGKKFGLPRGLGKELKAALGPWAKVHNVKTKGLPS
jgi:hypothetical protein